MQNKEGFALFAHQSFQKDLLRNTAFSVSSTRENEFSL